METWQLILVGRKLSYKYERKGLSLTNWMKNEQVSQFVNDDI